MNVGMNTPSIEFGAFRSARSKMAAAGVGALLTVGTLGAGVAEACNRPGRGNRPPRHHGKPPATTVVTTTTQPCLPGLPGCQ